MDDLKIDSRTSGSVPELKHTSGVTGSEDVDTSLSDLFHFCVENGHGKVVLDDIVDSRTAAALLSSFHLNKLDPGDGLEQLSRFCLHALPMNKVTRVVVAYAFVQRDFQVARQSRRGEEFSDIFHLGRESLRALLNMRVFLQHGAATCGVHQNSLY